MAQDQVTKELLGDCQVVDKIRECEDPTKRTLLPERVGAIAVHRTIWEPGDAVGACARFKAGGDLADYTGGETPYTFMIQPDAAVVQCLELGDRGAHARRWNSRALSVALMWPLLKEPATHQMQQRLVWLCSLLCLWAGGVHGTLFGHDELLGAAKGDKQCPGPYVKMPNLRSLVAERLRGKWGIHGTVAADRLLIDASIVL